MCPDVSSPSPSFFTPQSLHDVFRGRPGDSRETEDIAVDIRPDLTRFSRLDGNILSLRRLDVDTVRVIATAMGQSVAMEHYGKQVDGMMAEFERLSVRLLRSGGKFNIPKKELFALVASSNLVMIDVVRNIGLMERSEPAWRDTRYDELWETIRRDLELIDRFNTLKMKANMIQESSQVYLDILNNRRSDLMELSIIVLLVIEILVMTLQILVEADAIGEHTGDGRNHGFTCANGRLERRGVGEEGRFLLCCGGLCSCVSTWMNARVVTRAPALRFLSQSTR